MPTTHDFPSKPWNHDLPVASIAHYDIVGYVDKKAIAQFLDISTRTVENWTRLKRIPYIKLGGKYVRYRLTDVEKAIRKNYAVKEVSL